MLKLDDDMNYYSGVFLDHIPFTWNTEIRN